MKRSVSEPNHSVLRKIVKLEQMCGQTHFKFFSSVVCSTECKALLPNISHLTYNITAVKSIITIT